MEGRWTIWTDEDTGVANIRIKGPDMPWQPVEVVPCDDAAIERVAAKLAEIQGYHAGPLEIDRRSARALLRAAAGETP